MYGLKCCSVRRGGYWRLRTDVASRVAPCAVNRNNFRSGIFYHHKALPEWKGQTYGLYVEVGI